MWLGERYGDIGCSRGKINYTCNDGVVQAVTVGYLIYWWLSFLFTLYIAFSVARCINVYEDTVRQWSDINKMMNDDSWKNNFLSSKFKDQ